MAMVIPMSICLLAGFGLAAASYAAGCGAAGPKPLAAEPLPQVTIETNRGREGCRRRPFRG